MDVPEKLNYLEFKHGKYAASSGFIFWVLQELQDHSGMEPFKITLELL